MTSAYKKKKVEKKYPNKVRKNLNATRSFKKYLKKFTKLSRKIRSNYDMDTEADRIKREIDDLREEVDYIKDNLVNICNHLGVEQKP